MTVAAGGSVVAGNLGSCWCPVRLIQNVRLHCSRLVCATTSCMSGTGDWLFVASVTVHQTCFICQTHMVEWAENTVYLFSTSGALMASIYNSSSVCQFEIVHLMKVNMNYAVCESVLIPGTIMTTLDGNHAISYCDTNCNAVCIGYLCVRSFHVFPSKQICFQRCPTPRECHLQVSDTEYWFHAFSTIISNVWGDLSCHASTHHLTQKYKC